MAGYGMPSAPNPSPAIATGLYGISGNAGRSLEDIIGGLPSYGNWDAAIAKTPGSDLEKTNYLRSVYGLGDSWKVEGGHLVSDDHSLRNGLLVGGALLGGVSALGALGGGAGGAAASGVTTGGTYAAPVSAGVAGASGAAAGGAGMAIPGLDDILLKYGVPLAGNLIGTKMQVDANGDAAKLQNDFNLKALAAAQEEQQYQRGIAAEQQTYNRGQFGNYLTALQPYRAAGTSALERMQSALSGSAYQPNNGYRRQV